MNKHMQTFGQTHQMEGSLRFTQHRAHWLLWWKVKWFSKQAQKSIIATITGPYCVFKLRWLCSSGGRSKTSDILGQSLLQCICVKRLQTGRVYSLQTTNVIECLCKVVFLLSFPFWDTNMLNCQLYQGILCFQCVVLSLKCSDIITLLLCFHWTVLLRRSVHSWIHWNKPTVKQELVQ